MNLVLLLLYFFLLIKEFNCFTLPKHTLLPRNVKSNYYHHHIDKILSVKSSKRNVEVDADGVREGGLFGALLNEGVSIGAGFAGLILLLINRLSIPIDNVTDVQSRTDIISVISCSALLLNVLSESNIVAKDRSAVSLVGYALREPVGERIIMNNDKK